MDRPNPISQLFNSTEEGKPWVITLPSEAEWEKSARGMLDARSYPWGPEVDPNKANYRESGVNKTSTVGCFEGGCSPYKIQDLSGNVLEWTRSNWGIDVERLKFKYPYDPHDGREATGAPDTMLRIMRGGAFNSPAEDILCSCRTADLPKTRYDHVGFRLVITQQPL
jgi:formylglycine-generating enzyme required for sulfatase activity